jgi:asparagine synthase (glutamine-hydrolysing)
MPPTAANWDPLSRAQWLEMTTLLPGYILASQGDRMLMANSVEGRFPFLDPGVVSYANGLPARQKLMGLDEKFLLKYAFADLVPSEILYRAKQPYRAPDAASFFSAGEPAWLTELVSTESIESSGIFDPLQVSGLVQKARRRSARFGNTDNMRTLAILSTQLLHYMFIDQSPAPSGTPTPPKPLHVFDITNTHLGDRHAN